MKIIKSNLFGKKKHYLDSEDLPSQQQEALLNIFNRKRLQSAGFTRVGKGWFLKKKCSTRRCRTRYTNERYSYW